MEDLPVFRAPKKRKLVQNRHGDEEKSTPPLKDSTPATTEVVAGDGIANVIRVRKPSRIARNGITFSNTLRPLGNGAEATALVPIDSSNDEMKDMANRFIGSTGQVVDEDKHMMAYIDSEIAKRRQLTPTTTSTIPPGTEGPPHHPLVSTPTAPTIATQPIPTRPNPQHQLSEVDLGPDSTVLNTQRTTAAIQCTQSGAPALSPETTDRPPRRLPRKPRLGRDGKPLRPRPRKRRNSTDIARDALVEQVLHEHKLENVYQAPAPTAPNADSRGLSEHKGEQGDTDEAFAERFRQDFLDQIAERKQAQQQKKKTGAGTVAATEKTGGPKLGGSRAARAKMAALQQHQGQGQGQGHQGGLGEKKK